MGYPPFITQAKCRCSQHVKPAFHNHFSPLIILLLQSAVVLNPPQNRVSRGATCPETLPRSSVESQSILDTLSPHKNPTGKQNQCHFIQGHEATSLWNVGFIWDCIHSKSFSMNTGIKYADVSSGGILSRCKSMNNLHPTLHPTLSLDFQMFWGTPCQKLFYPRVFTLSPSPRLNNFF